MELNKLILINKKEIMSKIRVQNINNKNALLTSPQFQKMIN